MENKNKESDAKALAELKNIMKKYNIEIYASGFGDFINIDIDEVSTSVQAFGSLTHKEIQLQH